MSSNSGVIVGNTSGNYVGVNNVNWTNAKLVTLAGCRTSYNPEDNYSNISVEIYRKGARNVVGWQQEVGVNSLTEWTQRYHNKLDDSGTVVQAIQYANSFSYADSRVKNIGFFGPSNTTISSVGNTTYSINSLNTYNPNTTIVTNDIEFTSDNGDLENILEYLESRYSEFNKNDYEINVYTLNKEQNCYTIDLVRKIGDYYTDLGYVVGVENGKVTSITNNNTTQINSSLLKSSISEKNLNTYKQEAINNVKEKSANKQLTNAFNNTNITVNKQESQLYLDVNTQKTYYRVFTTYENSKGDINVDTYMVEI